MTTQRATLSIRTSKHHVNNPLSLFSDIPDEGFRYANLRGNFSDRLTRCVHCPYSFTVEDDSLPPQHLPLALRPAQASHNPLRQPRMFLLGDGENGDHCIAKHARKASLRVADARDFENQAALLEAAGDAEAFVFPEIGVALLGSQEKFSQAARRFSPASKSAK